MIKKPIQNGAQFQEGVAAVAAGTLWLLFFMYLAYSYPPGGGLSILMGAIGVPFIFTGLNFMKKSRTRSLESEAPLAATQTSKKDGLL